MKSEERLIWLNGNDSSDGYLALGAVDELVLWKEKGALELTKSFIDKHDNAYLFGWFSYDLKNDIEGLTSNHPSWVPTPTVCLIRPEHLAQTRAGKLEVVYGDETKLRETYEQLQSVERIETSMEITPEVNREEYLVNVNEIKRHIQIGDIYEMNYCYENRGEGQLVPLATYHRLNSLTQAPFSTFIQLGDLYVMSASPERFIRKTGSRLFTQPIKGTIGRGETEEEDQLLIEKLRQSPKDRSENVMIVDLVRNDLSRIARPSSVQVEELCEIYTFENIHQMISTVSAEVEDTHPVEILKALFPMGSMTGAPKIRAMEIIEQYEQSKRGLYSGCIGYFTPEGDFDFNVVIRTIIYDDQTKKSSFSVGGAITDLSTPEGEYEETLLKANAMKRAMNS
jgi:para-aminobenzoate synthetase component 1